MLRSVGWVLVVAVVSSVALAGEMTPAPPLDKGPVSNKEVCEILLDRMAYFIRNVNDFFLWDEEKETYVEKPGQKLPHWEGSPPWQNVYGQMMLVALDGSEEQVAVTGLSREELMRRGRRGKSWSSWLKDMDEETWRKLLETTAQRLADSPRVVPTWNEREEQALSLAFDDRMDYGGSERVITCISVPQDFADPRLIAGRPIKDWMARWDKQHAGQPFPPRASFAPDFSSDHHVIVNVMYGPGNGWQWYTMGPFAYRLAKGKPIEAHFTSPLSHSDELGWWVMRLTAGDGQFHDPMGSEYHVWFSNMMPAYVGCVYKSPEALAFAARAAHAQRAGRNYPFNGRTGTGWLHGAHFHGFHVLGAYLVHRLCGGPEEVMTYAQAARKVHGSYWYRYHRYGVHRTPDKLVTVGWNGIARASGREKIDWWKLSQAERIAAARYTYRGAEEARVTQVVPDNDALRPAAADPLFVMSWGGAFGKLYNSSPVATTCRVDRSDAVFSTAGRILRYAGSRRAPAVVNVEVVERAVQYQSFTSFYDKTCISLARILRGKHGLGSETEWRDGFACSFYTDARLAERRDCAHAGGTLDLKPLVKAVTVGDDLNGYQIKGTNETSFDSPWWCVNDRLGVATVGGQGRFKARTVAYHDHKLPGIMIGVLEPLRQGPMMVDMAAAYYTDTPAEKVAQLQKTLKPLDKQLPEGWKGLVSDTPDGQRVLALARFYGKKDTAEVALSFPEGAPIFEAESTIKGNTASARFTFDKLESMGQTLAFYVSGGVTRARQIGDTCVELEGEGRAVLKYLSRAEKNEIQIDGKSEKVTRAQLKTGIPIPLARGKRTVVRVTNAVDEDHTGPAVEVVWPQYLTDEQCQIQVNRDGWEPDPLKIGKDGLTVKVMARDRSGVKWVDVYLDWEKVGRLTRAPYELKLNRKQVTPGIHAFHAVACDALGNEEESFSVPVRVVE